MVRMKEIKKTKQNVYISIISIFILGLLNVFKMRLLIQNLGANGDQYNGLYQMLAQLLVYLSILETGLRFPAISSLFEPFVKNDVRKIAGILNGVKKRYIQVFLVTLILGVLTIPLAVFAAGNLPVVLVVVVSFLFVLRLVIPFLFQEILVVINADNNAYWGTTAFNVANILASLAAIIVIIVTHDFLYVVIAETLIVVFVTSGAFLVFKKKYKRFYNSSVPALYVFDSEVSGSRSLRFADALMNNTDVIVVSVVLGTVYASSFATYNATSTILFLVVSTTIVEAIKGLLGKVYSEHNKGKIFISMLHDIKYMNYLLISSTIPMLCIFLKPFTEMFFQPQYQQTQLFIFIFTLYFYLRMLRTPYHALKISMNRYSDFSKITLINAIVNITLSIFLTYFLGTIGVLLGSAIALVMTEFWYDINKLELTEGLFTRKLIFRELLVNASITWLLSAIGVLLIQPHLVSLVDVIIWTVPVFVLIISVNVGIYSTIYPKFKMIIMKKISARKSYNMEDGL